MRVTTPPITEFNRTANMNFKKDEVEKGRTQPTTSGINNKH